MARLGNQDGRQAAEPFVGRDGLATLALSCLVMLGTAGLSLIAAFCHVVRVGLLTQANPAACDRILVLGYRLTRDQQPAATYRARLERALALLHQAPGAQIFLLGGSRRAGQPSEAAIGAAWLQDACIDPDRIHRETRSRHTLENLGHYRSAFPPDPSGRSALVSSRFHLARATLIAEGLGLAVIPCAAEPDRWAMLRRPDRLLAEALLLHWYVVGRVFSRCTGHRGMLARLT